MNIKAQILKDTFEQSFEMARFERFAKEFFNRLEIVAPNTKITNYMREFSYTIAGHYHVANYSDSQDKRIAILAIELNVGRNIERARSTQRNFVSKLISNSGHDAAIVAFYTENEPKWRLSLVRLDQEWIGGGKVKTTITPAKRFSYLVGEKEPCHTAQKQLFPIFRNEDYNPTLDKIEEAFSVETVTDEFFEAYKSKYHDLREHLEGNQNFKQEAVKHQFSSEQFAKKIMGQLAFLYFLQKKGWLGVKVVPQNITEKQYKNAYYKSNASRAIIGKMYEQKSSDVYRLKTGLLSSEGFTDEDADILASCFTPEPWGSGTKSFIRDLFDHCKKQPDKNFFDDYLEPLFYEALRLNRGESQYYKRFNCKIPFLNGGLFDPLENYDWKHISFDIQNSMFSNRDEKGERNCDGILDVFERYNFTMNEDEPLEREVAVDPEMLGKIFENLLDVTDRKSKGVFYTPREIVHYMCQESLINYLVNEIAVPYEDVKKFILYGEIMKDEDCSKTIDICDDSQRQMPKSIFVNLRKIDKALENIKVADPAVGSGAFPLGMISEIVRARNNITDYHAIQIINENKKLQSSQRAQYREGRSPYIMKWNTIKNSIYAVDIEASAVDIAKLRLWLSLVVEEDLEPTFDEKVFGVSRQKDPNPLPNLDYNIMCGNSLIDEFEGIKLFDESVLENETSTNGLENNFQFSLFQDQIATLTEHLFAQQDRLFGENNSENKAAIKKSIDKTIDDIIRAKLSRDGNTIGLSKYEESLKQKTKPYFLWKLEFAKVFKEKGGFDVVIGNPPYISYYARRSKSLDTKTLRYYQQKYDFITDYTLDGKFNSVMFFLEHGIHHVKQNGTVSFIIDVSFFDIPYRYIRKFLLENSKIKYLMTNLSHFKNVFSEQLIIQYEKEINSRQDNMVNWFMLKDKGLGSYTEVNVEQREFYENDKCDFKLPLDDLQNSIISKIEVHKELVDLFPGKLIRTCMSLAGHEDDFIINASSNFDDNLIFRYIQNAKNMPDAYCGLMSKTKVKYDVELKDSLNRLYREDAYNEIRRQPKALGLGSYDAFCSPKLFVRQSANKIISTYTEEKFAANTSFYIITEKDEDGNKAEIPILYLLPILNSSLISYYAKTRGLIRGGDKKQPQIMIKAFKKIPICIVSKNNQEWFIEKAKTALSQYNENNHEYLMTIEEIDNKVFDIYGISVEERSVIKTFVKEL